MSLVQCAEDARRDEEIARFRRAFAVRALVAEGNTQTAIARDLGVTQPAVSQLLQSSERVRDIEPGVALEAAAPVLKELAARRGLSDLAVFGSAARGDARADSDIDLVVRAPKGTTIMDLVSFAEVLSKVLGRDVDVITYGSLKQGLDDDIRREMVRL
jgi:predicted nucleotidyltransferase